MSRSLAKCADESDDEAPMLVAALNHESFDFTTCDSVLATTQTANAANRGEVRRSAGVSPPESRT